MSGTGFHPAVQAWFDQQFAAATSVQRSAWSAIASGSNTLISAPTGSGKTLAAFLAVIDDLVKESIAGGLEDQTRVLYVSPLKALSNDIQKNLQLPLAGIRDRLFEAGLPDAPIRAWLRTGDTPQSERARMRNRPPHILVTTPESLYILLTSASGREMLRTVRTVIVDEIHAVAVNKRGAHLALSLARLDDLCERPPVRVGISATIDPIDVVARFLTGPSRPDCEIVNAGHRRKRDLAIELPRSPLEAVMANEVWIEIYDRLAELIAAHRTTLVFVNTRRMAERLARHLAERCGAEHVTAHHGSLAKEHRLKAEEALKAGKLKALVATASLELGIDIGDVDLVCQLGSPRGISTFLQRVGRSGHGIDRLPKGRLLPLSRDELVESVALLECVEAGSLDRVALCRQPLDVLAQQIVAEVSMVERGVEELFASVKRTAPYEHLSRESYLAVVKMLTEGFSTQRGRRSAYLHHDRVNGILRPRRSARLTAVTNGGAIPDQFDYDVVRVPDELFVGTLNEDFAFESLPGDIFQLGNTSYRIVKVNAGKVYVEDAHGQPPTIPFWFGEAPGRSDELSAAVSALRSRLDDALGLDTPERVAADLSARLELGPGVAEQLVDYLAGARAALGRLPTAENLVIERFFDETGDAHLVIHSPLGSRLNRAWGLALRKRFCRRFNFELQAAALEDAIVISLGAVHSFALEEVAAYLSSKTVEHVLSQAVLTAPMFPGHWRWNATIALAVRRFRNGRKAPAPFQRNDAEDLMATVFPDQIACAENLAGERDIPDHPLVEQTMHDCLREVMDLDGLTGLLERLETGTARIHCRDLTSPSPFAQEVLCAKPYAFLDDAPAEERRTLAVQTRRYMTVAQASELGRLDARAIARVREEAWPAPRDIEELHDALVGTGFLTLAEVERGAWFGWLEELAQRGRATRLTTRTGAVLWVAAERLGELRLVHPQGTVAQALAELDNGIDGVEHALRELTRSRLGCLGPVKAGELAMALGVDAAAISQALLALEVEGVAMRGRYTAEASDAKGADEEWCERSLLARIHRYTLNRLRSEIEPVTVADYQRFLFEWQGLGRHRRRGVESAAAVLSEFQGMAAPAIAWEQEILPTRLDDYAPDFLDRLTAEGRFVWWHPAPRGAAASGRPRRLVRASAVAILPRQSMTQWLALEGPSVGDQVAEPSAPARRVAEALERSGALFFLELVQSTGLLRVQTEDALAELAAAGRVTSDSFRGLRALLTPQSRRRGFHGRARRHGPDLDSAGRWALVRPEPAADRAVRAQAVEHAARSLLRRYGVICRRVLEREPQGASWRELLGCFRAWEASGEIRGGHFVAGLGGEQFALDEALPVLRRVRREADPADWLVLAAADPLNLAGILTPGGRVAAVAGHQLVYRGGMPVASVVGGRLQWHTALSPQEQAAAMRILGGSNARRVATGRRLSV